VDENGNIYYYTDDKHTWWKTEKSILAEKWNNPASKTITTRRDQLAAIPFLPPYLRI